MLFRNIQALRAIGAMMVLSIHVMTPPNNLGAGMVVQYFWSVGPAGVDIFFVISGFIVTTMAWKRGSEVISKGPAVAVAAEFFIRRVIRIYPIYWIALTFALLMFSRAPVSAEGFPHHALWRLYLLIEDQNFLIYAAWSLVAEMYFYVVVTVLLLLAPRRIYAGVAVWGAASIVAVIIAAATNPALLSNVLFSPLVIEFLAGAFISYLVLQKQITGYPVAALAIGIVAFIVGAELNRILWVWQPPTRALCFVVGASLIVYGFLAIELRYKWSFSQWWQTIGDASYSIYVWHQPLIFAAYWAVTRMGLIPALPEQLFIPTFFVLMLAWGLLSYRFVERPLQRWLLDLTIAPLRAALGAKPAPSPPS